MRKIILILALFGYTISSVALASDCEINPNQNVISETHKSFSDSILSSLIKMKNEEKLAHDVYITFYKKWGSIPFSNISSAEERHLNAVINLLKNYGSTDTLVGESGKFTNPSVQKLYNDLIVKGSESIEQAYKVGAWIEDLDIKDIEDLLSQTSNSDVIMVFENLQRGSRNHLRAFNRQLTNLGIVYKPQFISQSEFDQIVSQGIEKGQTGKNQCNKKCCRQGKCKRFGQK
jgi:hypothetical protein